MKTKTILITMGLGSALLFWGQSRADVLEMKNKSVLHGEYQGGTAGSVSFKVGDQVQSVRTSNILAITFGAGTNGTTSASSQGATGSGAGAATGAATTTMTQVTIPAGTSIMVIMDTAVDSSRDSVGKAFTGRTAEDIVVNGKRAIPAGSVVGGKLTQAQEARRLAGQSKLELVLTDVTVNDQKIPLVTENMEIAGAKEGKKTARRAAGGAIIGGIADGGDGAAKGAAIGGATALGKGESVIVPSGSKMAFRTLQPILVK